METVGATSNLHMTMPDALKGRVRMPGVAGFGSSAVNVVVLNLVPFRLSHADGTCSIFSGPVVLD